MKELEVEVAIPIADKDGPLALILLGSHSKKKIYEPSDLDALDLLARLTAPAFTASYRLEKQNTTQRLGQFSQSVMGIAHEFSNSLIPARTFLELLPFHTEEIQNPEHLEFVDTYRETALEQIHRSFRIIKTLKSLNTEENPRYSSADFTEIVSKIVDQLLLYAKEKSSDIQLELPPTPIFISCDKDLLTQAISNIIINAIDFSEKSPIRIVLSLDNSSFSEFASRAVFSVYNKAVIPPDELPHIFEPFYTKRNHLQNTGTGFGLALSKKIIHHHQGTLLIRSHPKEGTTAVISLEIITSL